MSNSLSTGIAHERRDTHDFIGRVVSNSIVCSQVYPLDAVTNNEGLIRWYRRCGYCEDPDQENKMVKKLSGFAG